MAGGCRALLSQVYIQLVLCRVGSSSFVCWPLSMEERQSSLFWFDCAVPLQELNGWAQGARERPDVSGTL